MKFSTSKTVAASGLMLLTASAFAAGQQVGSIVDIRVSSLSLANPTHVQVDGAYQNRPACAVVGFWAIDSDTSAGKSFLATLMLAKAQGKQVTLAGSGTCSLRSDMETIVQIQITQ
jgi:hypothetical protein